MEFRLFGFRRLTLLLLLCLGAILPPVAPGSVSQPAPKTSAKEKHGSAPPAVPESFHLFLLVGQSNMAGRGKIEEQDKSAHPRVWKLNRKNEWEPGVDPLHFDKPRIAGVGLGTTFARTLVEKHPGIHVGLIPCAVGGTSIDRWRKGGSLYSNAVARAQVAMKHGKLKGILWHQGESDAGSKEKLDSWFPKLSRLIHDFRTDLSAPTAPFVAGQLSRAWGDEKPLRKEFNIRLLRYARFQTSPYFAAVHTSNLTAKPDKTHFDSAALRELGRRYAGAWEDSSKTRSDRDPEVAPKAIKFNGQPISQVVSTLAIRGALPYAVEPDVIQSPQWAQPYHAELAGITAKRALQGILSQVGLALRHDPGNDLFWIRLARN